MQLSILGATGAVGGECLAQCLEAGHEVTVLVRSVSKLPPAMAGQVDVIEGDGLDGEAVARAIPLGTDAVLSAIGVDRHSPEDLCTDVTRHTLSAMKSSGARRLVWCGGGSTVVPEDRMTFGARFVELFASTFLGLRHRDKAHQLELLEGNKGVEWVGVRPPQMRAGARLGVYRCGFDAYSGFSRISFADCAHAMISMLDGDTWLYKAPIIQY